VAYHVKQEIMKEIEFRWVGRNKKFNEITINNDLTVSKILEGNVLSFFNNSNRTDIGNCEFLSEDLFTGEKDKNGIKIYNGDILSKCEVSKLGENIDYFYVVKWSSSNHGFRAYRYRLDENENGLYWKKQPSDDSITMVKTYNHLIGNVYVNAELFAI
jgi:hypothetical protein